ncbi:uncharacterized protein LOC120124424 [Hibiscus syriacus]|uniref:uncharacterized protein LOC120124424 n=1 Tax=Hibiscus syriacus TaxID=106335 RepID=UPI0019233498|nr:uncharacterized protein LOC120124424 [Hibiscus syriacus]
MKDIQDFIQDLHLYDHTFFGPSYTWSNKQHQSFLAKKLDRVLINPICVHTFHNSFLEFFSPGASDHCMALVWINREAQANRPKPFKIFNFWTLHPNFLNEVQQSRQLTIQGNPMKILFQKLKRLKACLKIINKECYSDISARVRQKRSELEQLQLSTLIGEHTIEKELMLQNELLSLEEVEGKTKRDTIRILVNDQGRRLESFDEIASEVTEFYSSLLDVSSNIVNEVTDEEIQEAIFNQRNDKAHGPDGFTPYFFKNPAFNATTIALVPKVPNPNKVRDFRPISCCSVIYKTITKILVKRLTTLLPGIISLNQLAFVKGRNIVDNTFLAQELVYNFLILSLVGLKPALQKQDTPFLSMEA